MLPDLGRISVLAPCSLMRGFVPYTKFPEVLGKFNTTRKSNRLIRELKDSCGHQLYASKMSIQNEFIPLIFEMIVGKLQTKEQS